MSVTSAAFSLEDGVAEDAEDAVRRHRGQQRYRLAARGGCTRSLLQRCAHRGAVAPHTFESHLPDVSLTLHADSGVFAGSAVDPGTKILLLEAPEPPPAGELLDLGCGYGPIALTLASRSPGAHVWAVDVNERARALCAANAEANGLANITVAAPDAVPDHVRFAAIWSNPPIRIGKAALHALLLQWRRPPKPPPASPTSSCRSTSVPTRSCAGWPSKAGPPPAAAPGRAASSARRPDR